MICILSSGCQCLVIKIRTVQLSRARLPRLLWNRDRCLEEMLLFLYICCILTATYVDS